VHPAGALLASRQEIWVILIFHCLVGIVAPMPAGPSWKSRVLQESDASAYMWYPVLVPQIVGGFPPGLPETEKVSVKQLVAGLARTPATSPII